MVLLDIVAICSGDAGCKNWQAVLNISNSLFVPFPSYFPAIDMQLTDTKPEIAPTSLIRYNAQLMVMGDESQYL